MAHRIRLALKALPLVILALVAVCSLGGCLGVQRELDVLRTSVAEARAEGVVLLAEIERIAHDPALDEAARAAQLAALQARVQAAMIEPVDALAEVIERMAEAVAANGAAITEAGGETLVGLAERNPIKALGGLVALLASLGYGGRTIKRQVHAERNATRPAAGLPSAGLATHAAGGAALPTPVATVATPGLLEALIAMAGRPAPPPPASDPHSEQLTTSPLPIPHTPQTSPPTKP